MWKVAAIGECMLELSNPGAKPLQRNMSLQFSFGGDTLNTAVYLSRLGVDCTYVTALGDDPYSDWLTSEWQAEGVDTSLVAKMPGRNPGLYMIQTDAVGERSFHYWRKDAPARELFAEPARAEALFQRLAGCDWIYLSGITLSLYDSASQARLFAGLRQFKQNGGRIAFDGNYRPAGWVSPTVARAAYQQICSLAHMVLPTFDDEAALFGDATPAETAQRLHSFGVEEVAVKHGAEGVLVSAAEASEWVPTKAIETIVDSTAAGDSFNGGYIAARAHGLSSTAAASVGNQLAGAVIQQPGAIIALDAMPNLDI